MGHRPPDEPVAGKSTATRRPQDRKSTETDCYRAAMTDRQAWDLAFDPATGRRLRQEEVTSGILPDSRWPNFF